MGWWDVACRRPATTPELDARGCPALQGARFVPATDLKGAPAYGVVDVQVKWPQGLPAVGAGQPDIELSLARLPAGVTGRPVADLVLAVNRTGGVDACEVVGGAGSAALDTVACSSGVKAADIRPAKAPDGSPAPSVQGLRVRFVVYPHYGANRRGAVLDNLYPERAQRLGLTGFAVVRCEAAADGLLKDCAVAEEGPPDVNFGLAAMRLVTVSHMRVTPDQQGEVFVPVGFYLQPCAPPPDAWVSVCGQRIGDTGRARASWLGLKP